MNDRVAYKDGKPVIHNPSWKYFVIKGDCILLATDCRIEAVKAARMFTAKVWHPMIYGGVLLVCDFTSKENIKK